MFSNRSEKTGPNHSANTLLLKEHQRRFPHKHELDNQRLMHDRLLKEKERKKGRKKERKKNPNKNDFKMLITGFMCCKWNFLSRFSDIFACRNLTRLKRIWDKFAARPFPGSSRFDSIFT